MNSTVTVTPHSTRAHARCMKAERVPERERDREKIKKGPTAARIVCGVAGIAMKLQFYF